VRRYLALFLGLMFVLGFATSAFAITAEIPSDTQAVVAKGTTQITLGGRILARGWYVDNLSANLPANAESAAAYTTNVFLTVDAKVSENVRGFLELETSNNMAGTSGIFFWGNHDTKPYAELLFRQAWIQYSGSGLIGVPAGIKAGHQLLALGEKQFLRHERFGDDAILVFVAPTKELSIAALTAKLAEGDYKIHRDDIDGYVLLGTYKLDKNNTLGLNYTLIHSDAGAAPPVYKSLNFQNLGVHANGKVTGLSYAVEGDLQFGKMDGLVAAEDQKFRGYGIFAKLGYKVDPVNLRASFAMGSGDSDATDNKNKEFQTLVGMDTQSFIARFPNYTQIYERATRTAANNQSITGNIRTTGIANTTYYNIGMDVKPTKDLSLSLDGYILRATKAWTAGQKKDMGTEVDFTGSYKLAKNLSYFITAATFNPGDYYATSGFSGVADKTINLVVHGLDLRF